MQKRWIVNKRKKKTIVCLSQKQIAWRLRAEKERYFVKENNQRIKDRINERCSITNKGNEERKPDEGVKNED